MTTTAHQAANQGDADGVAAGVGGASGSALAQPLDVRRRGAAMWLTLNRPAALNGIDAHLVRAAHAALDQAQGNAEVHAVVIAAAGRVFCAGADLKFVASMANATDEDAAVLQQDFLADAGGLFTRIEHFPKPVIAAVHGVAVAGGLELVLACDVVIAARSARFGDAHANYGLLPGGGASVRLPRRVGAALAKYLMFTGIDMPAAELAHTDLIARLVDDDQLQTAVEQTVTAIARKSPAGVTTMKRLVLAAQDTNVTDGLAAELTAVAAHARSHDFHEGLHAFISKRRPEFNGS